MQLNTIKPACGAKKAPKRLGRGVGSGLGKTAGRGHKGQHARAGLSHKPGFEGGQMPIQRRLPKFGFHSRIGKVTAEVRLAELNKMKTDIVDIFSLKESNIINTSIEFVKVFVSGEITKPLKLRGIKVSAGAKKAIIAAGGSVE